MSTETKVIEPYLKPITLSKTPHAKQAKQFWTACAARDYAARREDGRAAGTDRHLKKDVEKLVELSSSWEDFVEELNRTIGNKTAKEVHKLQSRGKPKDLDPAVTEVLETLKTSAAFKRQAEWSWRCGEEARSTIAKGGYMLFVTLTFRDELDDDETYKAWRSYYARFRRVISQTCGVPPSECVRHFFYGEGKDGVHRRHLHGIWYLDDIPAEWKVDPNRGWMKCNRQQPWGLNELWPYGFSMHKAVRHADDAWSKLGWRWPVVNGKPLKMLSYQAATRYVTKYIAKSILDQGEKSWIHRAKVSRSLGLNSLRTVLTCAPRRHLRPLSTGGTLDNPAQMLLRKCGVPRSLLRREAKRERFFRLWACHPRRLMKLRKAMSSRVLLLEISDMLRVLPTLSREGFSGWYAASETILALPGPGSVKRVEDAFGYLREFFEAPSFMQHARQGGI